MATTALLPSASLKYGCVGSTPESITPTETPLPVSLVPSAPVRVWVASSPRVAWLEVVEKNSMGWSPASTYWTPGWLRSVVICALVPDAATTPIFAKVRRLAMPVAVTARVESASVAPCTRTVVLPVSEPSCLLR